jgi:hypothetical protein
MMWRCSILLPQQPPGTPLCALQLLPQPSAATLWFAEVLASRIAAAGLFILTNTYATAQKYKISTTQLMLLPNGTDVIDYNIITKGTAHPWKLKVRI